MARNLPKHILYPFGSEGKALTGLALGKLEVRMAGPEGFEPSTTGLLSWFWYGVSAGFREFCVSQRPDPD